MGYWKSKRAREQENKRAREQESERAREQESKREWVSERETEIGTVKRHTQKEEGKRNYACVSIRQKGRERERVLDR